MAYPEVFTPYKYIEGEQHLNLVAACTMLHGQNKLRQPSIYLKTDEEKKSKLSWVGSFIRQDWIEQTWLRMGQISSLCVAQSINGLVESKKFSGNYIVSDSDYHVYRYAQSATMFTASYFTLANIRSEKISWITKVRRVVGSTLVARDFFEWAYRANRTGDPFDYSGTHNEKALVYFRFSWSEKRFIDMYISGVGRQGVFIDLSCLILGWWIYE